MQKKVSVIIPTYNRETELMKSIQTVMDQTYKGDIEIIIVDDSKKSLKQKIDKIFSKTLHKNRKINYIHKAKKEGAPLARNIGIKQSSGDYIAFLDDDDEWMPEKIERQIDVMEKYPDCPLVICYSRDMRFGQDRINKPPDTITHKTIIKSFNLSSTSSYFVRRYSIEQMAKQENICKLCAGCDHMDICWTDFEVGIWDSEKLKCDDVRKKLKTKDYFDTSLPSAQEYDLAIRLSKYHDIRCVPEVLMIQNSTDGQISENWNRKIKGIKAIAKKYKHEYTIKDKVNTFGVVNLFRLAKIPGVGNKIYKMIIPIKERQERAT